MTIDKQDYETAQHVVFMLRQEEMRDDMAETLAEADTLLGFLKNDVTEN